MKRERGLRGGDQVVILDQGRYYGKTAEYQSVIGEGILVQCPVGAPNAFITAWRYKVAAPEEQAS